MSGFTPGRSRAVDTLHFTGGLRGHRVDGGWAVGPFLRDTGLVSNGPIADDQLVQHASELGIRAFGADERILSDPHLPTRIWHPFVGLEAQRRLPTETWANIAYHASEAGDEVYAELAQFVSVCLRASDIRLRDISDGYGVQLVSALARQTAVGHPFDNIALADLHLAIHSFVAEMGGARDYLSALVGIQLKAPASKDSLARLVDWLSAPSRSEEAAHPAAVALMGPWIESSEDPWLRQLTDYRNLFLHRGPMGARGFDSAPRLVAANTPAGELRKILLPIPARMDGRQTVDALEQFVRLHFQLFRLAANIADLAPYPTVPRMVTSADVVGGFPKSEKP